MYIVKIGVPYNERFKVVGYTQTKKQAVEYLKSIGYNHFHRDYNYYEIKIKNEENGHWARIEKISELILEDKNENKNL